MADNDAVPPLEGGPDGRGAPTVYSFDVFDTVLMRSVAAPEALIDLLARRLDAQGLLTVPPSVFAANRKAHEKRLNRILGRHAALREIYQSVVEGLVLEDALVDEFVRAEEELERELTEAVPAMVEVVEGARRRGRVAFVSDTPHSETFVHELLVLHGVAAEGDLVLTSADRGVTKAHGGLFNELKSELGFHLDYLHTGDNFRSDVAAARVEGLAATHRPVAQLNRYETLMEARSEQTDGLTSWLAGAARRARLEAISEGVPGPLADVASGVLGPLVVGFALWVTAQARSRGIQRLYFVARDGEIMLKAARHVIGALAPEIELRYLYGSRRPWILGACATSEAFFDDWIVPKPDWSARSVLAQLDVTPEQVHKLEGLEVCRPENADVRLSVRERQELIAALRRDPLLSLVRENAERTRGETIGYLIQEGFADQIPSALVDVGWGKITARAFNELVRAAHLPPVEHFMMGIKGSSDDLAHRVPNNMVAWLFDDQLRPGSWDHIPSPHTLFEVLVAGSTGRTLGYAPTRSGFEPVLAQEYNEPVLAWGLREVQETAERVAEIVASRLPPHAAHVDLTESVTSLLLAFWLRPTKSEAAAWGTFPWEEELWKPFTPLADRVTTRGVVGRFLRGDRQLRRVNSWRAGSAAMSPQPWRTVLKFRGWQHQNRQRLRRIPDA